MMTVLLLACADQPRPLVTLRSDRLADATRLTLIPTPGARINARLLPALERRDGSVLRFHGADLTPDSSYFTSPPSLEVRGDPTGIVRASVCPEGESVCRRVELPVRS